MGSGVGCWGVWWSVERVECWDVGMLECWGGGVLGCWCGSAVLRVCVSAVPNVRHGEDTDDDDELGDEATDARVVEGEGAKVVKRLGGGGWGVSLLVQCIKILIISTGCSHLRPTAGARFS